MYICHDTHTNIRTHTYTYTYTYTYTHNYTHARKHIHSYTHARTPRTYACKKIHMQMLIHGAPSFFTAHRARSYKRLQTYANAHFCLRWLRGCVTMVNRFFSVWEGSSFAWCICEENSSGSSSTCDEILCKIIVFCRRRNAQQKRAKW